MKTLYFIAFLIITSLACKAQSFLLSFEDTAIINNVFYTDSILDPLHIWQIGAPHKPFFDSAYTLPDAIVTLLDSGLPKNVQGAFIIKTEPTQYLFDDLSMISKFDFDRHTGVDIYNTLKIAVFPG